MGRTTRSLLHKRLNYDGFIATLPPVSVQPYLPYELQTTKQPSVLAGGCLVGAI